METFTIMNAVVHCKSFLSGSAPSISTVSTAV